MNYFLKLNKSFIILIIILLFSALIILITTKKKLIKINENKEINFSNIDTDYDIVEPKFTINNKNKKIYVTANQGNFIEDNNILLKEKVRFRSKDFIIYSDDVLFNQENQTAKSSNNSIFKSDGAQINSEGFNITEKGNIIKFNGKSKLTLTK